MIDNSKIEKGTLTSYTPGGGHFIELRIDTKKEHFHLFAQSASSYTVADYRMWDGVIKAYSHMYETLEDFEALK